MDRRIPVDHGVIIPADEAHPPGSFHDIQRRMGMMLADAGLPPGDGVRMLINVMVGIIAGTADTACDAQARMLHVARQIERLAPSAAQAHFELHHGGLRG